MRPRISALMVVLLLGQTWGFTADGQGRVSKRFTLLDDPIIGVSYDYTKVHYDPMPVSVRQICRDYDKGTFWTYAHAKRESEDYYVVMGVRPGQTGDSFGAAVVVVGSDCADQDSLWMLSGIVPAGGYSPKAEYVGLPGLDAKEVCDQMANCHYVLRSAAEEAILRDLVRDGISRAVKAWGGADRFKKEACKPSVLTGHSDTPIVQDELTKFCIGRP